MPLNYPNMKATATRLIQQNGAPAELQREDVFSYDPLSDQGVSVIQQWPVDVVLAKVRTGADTYDIEALPGTYDIGRISKALISGETLPVGIEPEPGDKIVTATGTVWTVIGNNPVRPQDDPVLHTCFVEKGA